MLDETRWGRVPTIKWCEALSGAARGGGRPSGTGRDLALPASVGSSTSRACLSACVRVSIPPPTAEEGGTSCQKPAVPCDCQLWEKSPRGNVDRYDIGERGCILGNPGVPRPTIPFSISPSF